MTDTYDKFDRATRDFTACALLWQDVPVGRVVIKFGNAATAYVQIWGAPMATGRATGYGYDKASAAVMAAIARLDQAPSYPADSPECHTYNMVRNAVATWNGGTRWDDVLRAAGFTIANVI